MTKHSICSLLGIFTMASCITNACLAKEPGATDPSHFKVADGFNVELLYSVPKDQQGSWVSMCVGPDKNLIVCDQYGKLYSVAVPAPGKKGEVVVTPIDVQIGGAQGLIWAFDSLYVVVNSGQFPSGLHRVTDSDGDGKLDKVTELRKLNGGGEHGPHAIMVHPDGKNLVIVCGNQTDLTKIDSSRVPQVWDEDLVLPRIYGRGFMRDKMAPGGYICKIDPEGKNWELLATGFRNEYDAAFNRDGELFTYDADMEWDLNTPWYRPTRICHVVSGAEFGWRNGSGKWPEYYEDSTPGMVDIGPGSPTGVTFGYGADFPQKYQDAFYACDWSYGKLYAVHLEPNGATYKGTAEEFITGTPLPLTDIVVNPNDKAMYFTVGGRKTQSGLYRVTYVGDKSKADAPESGLTDAMKLRRELEKLHVSKDSAGLDLALQNLGSDDRFLRQAARIGLEHHEPAQWQAKALELSDTNSVIETAIALARVGDDSLRGQLLDKLDAIDYDAASQQQKLGLLRAYELVLVRMGDDAEVRDRYLKKLDPLLPAQTPEENRMLAELLVRLQSPTAAPKLVALLEASPTQEEQIELAKSIRLLKAGWTDQLQERYFKWFHKAATYRGGASFDLFVQDIKREAVENLSDKRKQELAAILEFKPQSTAPSFSGKPRTLVKKWTVDDLAGIVEPGSLKQRNFDKGQQLFAEASCFACHRFSGQGGAIGPDLTALSGRFSPRDILESVILPSKQVSDQYQAIKALTDDGKVVVGRIVNLNGDNIAINTNMLDPNAITNVNRNHLEEIVPSEQSMMPEGLLDNFTEEEIKDLMAYMLSRGNRENEMFAK
ncbi:heme-binding protein [Blastopirellula marina]|uniref:Heme-binding protein n=2 Tax=Blastopirellula marina TaxID=124 RepID=A0A2S8GBF8_9BACT|nr:heme-binding protein [Blastopirellula marina]PTL46206.1 heme-binding protein [Blastopirellula marina]